MSILNLQIPAKEKQYQILIQDNLISEISQFFDFENYSKVVILTDERVAEFWLDKVFSQINKKAKNLLSIKIPAGEKNKNLATVEKVYSRLLEFEVDRKSLIVALGGGVIGDLAGFIAATWMRGVDFIQIPTTLLAQVDSSVGGKTGFDFKDQKNLIGAFKQPKKVLISPEFLATLPTREYIQGLAEVLKYGLIQDSNFWSWLKENQSILIDRKHPDFKSNIMQAIYKSCQIKAEIVSQDEQEISGIRQALNLGHTFGHSLESFSLNTENPLFHGEAIAIGINFISQLSPLKDVEKQEIQSLLQAFKLPTFYPINKQQNLKEIEAKLYKGLFSDKKNLAGKIKWVVLNKIGQAKTGVEIAPEKIKAQISKIFI